MISNFLVLRLESSDEWRVASGERQLLALKFVREMGKKLSIRKMEVFDIRLVKEISNFFSSVGER